MRRLLSGCDGSAYLGGVAPGTQPLARIKATGPALPVSRSIVWALARQRGFDPTRWQVNGNSLITWGGQTLNTLLAAIFTRSAPDRRFAPSPESVRGDIVAIDSSLEAVRELARQIEKANDLPLSIASRFVGPSRFLGELSDVMAAEEKRRSVPWGLLYRWLDRVEGVDVAGSVPVEPLS